MPGKGNFVISGAENEHLSLCRKLGELLRHQPNHTLRMSKINDVWRLFHPDSHQFLFPSGHGTTALRQAVEQQPYKNWFNVEGKTISLKPSGLQKIQGTITKSNRSNAPPYPPPAKTPTATPARPEQAPAPPTNPKQWTVTSNAELQQMELDVRRDRLSSSSGPNMLLMDLSSGYLRFALFLEDGTFPTIKISKEMTPRALHDGGLLREILGCPETVKVAHDIYEGAAVLREHGLANFLDPVFDLQLATEISRGKRRNISLLKDFGAKGSDVLQTLGLSALSLFKSLSEESLDIVVSASKARLLYAVSDDYAKNGGRPISYLPESNTFGSAELWDIVQDQPVFGRSTLHINVEIEPVLQLVPRELFSDFEGCLVNAFTHRLREFVLDKGDRPRLKLHMSRGPHFLHEDPSVLVTDEHLQQITSQLKIGFDHRAGIDGTLHRISIITNREGKALGATMRVGRHITGNVDFLRDCLTVDGSEKARSILVIGPPNTGKTTIIRELARLLSEDLKLEVIIVDTSNEIAGDGDIKHKSVGASRRMMVRTREEQWSVMIEGVQNHSPEVMIIDEIGRRKEVEAASTVKERGVSIIGSAHGNFRSLLRNAEIRGLLGGCQVVTLGDAAAKKENYGSKVRVERAGAPVFDVVVELEQGVQNSWTIYRNVGAVVDAIYAGKPYKFERRYRDAEGRLFTVIHEDKNLTEFDIRDGVA